LSRETIKKAIENAERVLERNAAPVEEGFDPNWQTIITVGEYIECEPHEVWRFIRKWGEYPDKDIRMAVATCLLEHLLEYHFEEFFSLVKKACEESRLFADTFSMCSEFGQTEQRENLKLFKALQNKIDNYK